MLDLLSWLLPPFLVLVSAGFGLVPIPEEAIIAYAGVHTAGEFRFGSLRWLMLPACILGAVIADVILYWGGRLFGSRLRKSRWWSRVVPPRRQEKIESNFRRYGLSILVVGRLVPGIRTTLFMTAGMMRLPMARFLLADAVGAVAGNSLFFLLGFWLGHQFAELVNNLEEQAGYARSLILVALLVGVAGYLLYQFARRPFPTGDPEELPLIGHQVAAHLPQSENGAEKKPAGAESSGEARQAGEGASEG